MTVNEAAELVIQAGSMGRGGEVFVLDMGNPVSIYEFARRVIEYSGHSVRDDMNPSGDITIEEIGLKPGEKLHEELLIRDNPEPTLHPKIMKLSEDFMPLDQLEERLDLLRPLLNENNIVAIRQLLVDIIHEYTPARKIIDLEWNSINSTNM
jgi:FlaA1/EpsC-like NDP-sugar epimerase